MSYKIIHEFEMKTLHRIVKAFHEAGMYLAFDHSDASEAEITSKSLDHFMDDVDACGEVTLNVYMEGKRNPFGWIYLVWGNGACLISDYTTNLERYLAPINEYLDEYYD